MESSAIWVRWLLLWRGEGCGDGDENPRERVDCGWVKSILRERERERVWEVTNEWNRKCGGLMTATGRDFFNAKGMYLDTVVVVVVVVDDDELGCYFLYLFDLELGFLPVGEGVCGFSVLGFFFGPCTI